MVQASVARAVTMVVVISIAESSAGSQAIVQSGPRPEVRALLDALLTAIDSGSADSWEAFSSQRFSPEAVKDYSREQRKQLYDRLRSDFGTVTFGRVMRRGPDEPLEIGVKGSTGLTGVIAVELDARSPRGSLRCGSTPARMAIDPRPTACLRHPSTPQ